MNITHKNSIVYIFLVLILISCKKNTKQASKFELNEIENFSFRRSYVGHESLNNKQLDSLYKGNPRLEHYPEYKSKKLILKKLNKLNVLKDDQLIVANFKNNLLKEFLDKEKEIEISYINNITNLYSIHVTIHKEKDSITKNIEHDRTHFIGLQYKDLDNDNVKELLLLENYYIMNGDNFNLRIFKLEQ